MIGRLKYRLFVMLLVGVGLPLCAMDDGATPLGKGTKAPSDEHLPDGSGDEADVSMLARPAADYLPKVGSGNDPEEEATPFGRGSVPLIGDPTKRVKFYIQLAGGTFVAVSATIGGLKFLKMQRGFAAQGKNSKHKMAGESENKWFFRRWLQRGMALLKRTQKN